MTMTGLGTDETIVRLARKMHHRQRQSAAIINQIRTSGHPHADRIADALEEECWVAAWPEHVIHRRLQDPTRWETGDYGIRKAKRQKLGRPDTKDRPYAVGGRGRRGW